MLRVIREEEPPKPSTRLSEEQATRPAISAQRQMDPAKLTKLVRGELDWIVMKALEKDRNRRYETANGFARDVQRYLVDEPVLACPPSVGYRLRKFARRNKVALGMAATILSTLLIAVVGLAVGNVLITLERNQKARALSDKEAALLRESAALGAAQKQEGLAKDQAVEAKKQARLARRRYYAAQMNLAVRAWEEGDTPRVLELLETQRPRFGEEDFRAFEWYALWQLCHQPLRFMRQASTLASYAVAYAPDSSLIALSGTDGTVRLLNAADGREVRTLQGGGGSIAQAVAFSPDGNLLAQAAGPTQDEVTLWNVATGELVRVLRGTGAVYTLAFSPDGKLLATSTFDGTVGLWETATGVLKESWRTRTVQAIGFSPDGKHLVTSNSRVSPIDPKYYMTQFWDLSVSPPQVVRELEARGMNLAFSADGKRFAVGTARAFALFDTQTWKEIPTKKGNWGYGLALAFVPGSNVVAVAVQSRSVRVVDIRTGHVKTLPHHASVHSLAVAPDGKAVAAIGADAVLKVWDLGPTTNPEVIDTPGYIGSLSFAPDGKTLAAGIIEMVRLFDLNTGALQRELKGHSLAVEALAFFRDSQTLAAGSSHFMDPGELKVWNVRTGQERQPTLEFNAAAHAIAITPDERSLAVGGPQGDLVLFDVTTGKRQASLKETSLTALAYSPDGKLLISAGSSGQVTLRDPKTGDPRLTFGPKEAVSFTWSLACSSDSKLLAAGSQVGSVHLWELPSGRLRATLRGNSAGVRSVAFFPDGQTLATANDAGEVKLWDVTTGQERITFRFGYRLAVSADGLTLAAGKTGKIQLLRAARTAEALALKTELNPDDPESPVAALDGGDRVWAAGDAQEAEKAYRRAHERLVELVAQFPQMTAYRRELVRSDLCLRLLLAERGATAEAEQLWQELQPMFRQLSADEQLALAHNCCAKADMLVGVAYRLQRDGKAKESLVMGRRAFDILADLAMRFPVIRSHSDQLMNCIKLLKDLAPESMPEVMATFSKIVEKNPDNSNLLAARGRWRLAAQQLQEGANDLGRALELGRDDSVSPHWRMERAHALETLKQDQNALAELTRATQQWPALWDTWVWRGGYYYRHQQWPQVIADCSKAVELNPRYGWSWHARAVAHANLKQWDKALADFTKLIELSPDQAAGAIDSLRALGRKDDADVLLLRAIAQFEKQATEAPDSLNHRVALADLHAAQAKIFEAAEKLAEAEKAYRRALAMLEKPAADLRPAYRHRLATAHHHLGGVQQRIGQRGEAEKNLRQAIAIWTRLADDFPSEHARQRDLATRHLELSRVLREAGKPQEAEKALAEALAISDKLLERKPTAKDDRFELATVYRELAREFLSDPKRKKEAEHGFRQAWVILEKLAAEYPNTPQYLHLAGDSLVNQAMALRAAKRPKEAEQTYRQGIDALTKLVARFPKEGDFPSYLGWARAYSADFWMDEKRLAEAEAEYRQALQDAEKAAAAFPDNANAAELIGHRTLHVGWHLINRNRHADAEKVLLKGASACEENARRLPGALILRWFAAVTSGNAAGAIAAQKRPADAEEQYRKTVEILLALPSDFYNVESRPQEASHWFNALLAELRAAKKDRDAAKSLEQVAEFYRRLTADFPDQRFLPQEAAKRYLELAIAHYQLDHKEEARKWYSRSVAWMKEHALRSDELHRLRTDTAKLLGVSEKKD
jgi:WD40 repeat protein/tetratricopeptide (TPR) repeat protein